MKKIKKLSLIALAIMLLLGLTACNDKKEENVTGKLEDIMEKLYKGIPEDNTPMGLHNIELKAKESDVDTENMDEGFIKYFVGTDSFEYDSAIASESYTGSVAHSVILIRTKENADIEKIKKDIKENVDPRKWICVGVEKDEVVIKNKGNLILVVIVEDKDNRNQIVENFDNL